MRVLKKSRKPVQAGDIFVYQMPDDLFRFGRVVRTDASIGGFKDSILVYFYRKASKSRVPIPGLNKNDLLIAPVGMDQGAWTRGYFETVEHRPLQTEDVLRTHCFWDDSRVFELYRDEYGKRIPGRLEPCGLFALASEVTIDAKLGSALGFLLSPDNLKYLAGKPRSVHKLRLAEGLAKGLLQEQAETEAQKAIIRYRGNRVEDYAWPGIKNEPCTKRAKQIKYGVTDEDDDDNKRFLEFRASPHAPSDKRRGFLWNPPKTKYLSGDAHFAYEAFLNSALSEGLPKDEAEFKALQTLVQWWGESIDDYDWSEVFPFGAKTKRTKKR